MSVLYILSYNNYFDRKQRPVYWSAGKYGEWRTTALVDINFNYDDGVTTTLQTTDPMGGDYMVVADNEDFPDVISSHWFILESKKICEGRLAGLYTTTLRRDLIADNLDTVKNAPCFVEKGYVPDSNPLIFNNENMGYNQIKQAEILLENKLKTPWIVAYLSRYHTNEQGVNEYNTFSGKFAVENQEPKADYVISSLNRYTYYYWSQNKYRASDNISFAAGYKTKTGTGWKFRVNKNTYDNTSQSSSLNLPIHDYPVKPEDSKADWQVLKEEYDTYYVDYEGLPQNKITGLGNTAGYNTLRQEAGKIIQVGKKYYQIAVTLENYGYENEKILKKGDDMYDSLLTKLVTNNNMDVSDQTVQRLQIEWPYTIPTARIIFNELSTSSLSYDITYKGTVTQDAAYEIIAAPYRNTSFTYNGTVYNSVGSLNLQWFQDIINSYNAAGWAYDIQLVPYIGIDQSDISDCELIKLTFTDGGGNASVGIKLPSASFRITRPLTLPLRDSVKVGNEVDMFRFVSPNGVGEFQFNPYKNGGVTNWEADVTLIPFNPYIHVHPEFGGLYGGVNEDFRGLIVSGDLSLPILNDKWSTYALSNKYYQQIFDRNISSQELNNSWSLIGDIAGAGAGAISGIGAGMTAGAAGGPVGAAIGGAVGGVVSAGAGVADVLSGNKLRNDEISRQKDQFGYQLGTIKAQANTLTRTTSYNISNKYFPYVEYYTATDTEVTALENKIKYEGYTLNVIGTINDYLNDFETTFIKGQLIQLPGLKNDSHTAIELYNEIRKGVYFVKEEV
nr:MAG TPA: protein of unknown function (DUF3482) [Herelleviridae sp.]